MMTACPMSPPISPSVTPLPRRGSDLGTAVAMDGVVAAGEAEGIRSDEFSAEPLDVEDAQPQKVLPTPELPSRAVVEEHRIDHWPPRSWCDECNEGHGRERRHGKVPESHRVAIISIDYAFVTRRGTVVSEGEDGWDDEEALKLLIVKDSLSRAVFAHAVPRKGIDEKRYAVDMVVDDVLWLGYAKVILKSDNEPSIVRLLKEALAGLKVAGLEQAGEEHSPPFDSQANGSVEAAVKLVKCRLRTLKLCLERRIGKKIPPRHPIMAWLAPHAAAILRYRSRGDDGKTPHEKIRLRPFNSRLLAFGEMCSYKMRSKEPLDDEHRWHHGTFLGICPTTGQYIVHCVERKVIRMARTIRCVPDESKWNAANIESVRVSPFDVHSVGEPGVVFQERPVQPGDADLPKKTTVRKIYIKGEDTRAFGFTIGCPKCDHDRRYGPGRTTKGHSNACRERIMGELMKTPEGLRRINAADERGIRNIAEQAEEASRVLHGGDVDDA